MRHRRIGVALTLREALLVCGGCCRYGSAMLEGDGFRGFYSRCTVASSCARQCRQYEPRSGSATKC